MNSKVNSKRDFSLGREYPRGNFRIIQSRTVIRQCALTILRTWNSCPSKNWRKPQGFTNVKVSVIGQVVTEKVTLRFRLGSFKGVGFAQLVLCGQLEELDNAFCRGRCPRSQLLALMSLQGLFQPIRRLS